MNGTTRSATLGSVSCGGQAVELGGHDLGAADRAAQDGLVQDHGQLRRRGLPPHQGLAGDPDMDAAVDLLLLHAGIVGLDDGAGVLLGL